MFQIRCPCDRPHNGHSSCGQLLGYVEAGFSGEMGFYCHVCKQFVKVSSIDGEMVFEPICRKKYELEIPVRRVYVSV
jgi:hypothetical protein